VIGENDGRHPLLLKLKTDVDQAGGLAHPGLTQDHQMRIGPDFGAPDHRFVARPPVAKQHRRLARRRRRAACGGIDKRHRTLVTPLLGVTPF